MIVIITVALTIKEAGRYFVFVGWKLVNVGGSGREAIRGVGSFLGARCVAWAAIERTVVQSVGTLRYCGRGGIRGSSTHASQRYAFYPSRPVTRFIHTAARLGGCGLSLVDREPCE
jgi:hypothetical protein